MTGAELRAPELVALRGLAGAAARMPEGLGGLPGHFRARQKGQGQDVADIRTYVPGDDARAVDRNVTARTGTLHVRTHHADRDRTLLLVADFRPSMLWGVTRAFRSVAAAEALVLLGWRAVEAGGRVGVVALTARGHVAVPARGQTRAMLAVIGALVRAHAQALEAARDGLEDPPLDAALEKVLRIAGRRGEICLASGFDTPGPALEIRLAELADRGELRRIRIGDGVRGGLPAGIYRLSDPGGRVIRADVSGEGTEEPGQPSETLLDPAMPPARALQILDGAHGLR
ncbi:DUF58 domain-containing protein [Marinibacterium profundimaris]|uniref:DUF58 domain-containing protein n=1 Tax=Marinibacterium profundimaris TaxID=1679460 RepID=UPI0018E976A6|nr:DUF58 domain-containing protein [Marinibacterium profundimaris]